MFEQKSKLFIDLVVILLWIWTAITALALAQRIINLNILPENLELIGKAIVVNFTLIVIVILIIGLYLHITEIYSILKGFHKEKYIDMHSLQSSSSTIESQGKSEAPIKDEKNDDNQ